MASTADEAMGDDALFAAFSVYGDIPFVDVHLRHLQSDKFRHAKSAAIRGFDDGAVAAALIGRIIARCLHGVDLIYGQDVGQLTPETGQLKQCGGIVVGVSTRFQKLEKHSDARHDACLRPGMDADVVEHGEKLMEQRLGDRRQSLVFLVQKLQQFLDIVVIRCHSVGRQAFLQRQMGVEKFYQCRVVG